MNTKSSQTIRIATHLKSPLELVGLLLLVFLIRTFGFGLYQVPSGSMETTMLVGERFFSDKMTYLFRDPARNEIIAFNDPRYPYARNSLKNLFERYVWGPTNFTKRVIGVPGDHVRGTVENGKAVVYVNGVKLDEPYRNAYPLVYEFTVDKRELVDMIRKGTCPRQDQVTLKSYDPSKPDDQQPFYRINTDRVLLASDGERKRIEPTEVRYFNDLPHDRAQRGGQNYYNGSDEFSVTLGSDEYWLMGDNRLGSSDSRTFGPVHRKYIHGRIIFRIWSLDSHESWFIVDLLKNPIDFWSRVRWNRFFQWIT